MGYFVSLTEWNRNGLPLVLLASLLVFFTGISYIYSMGDVQMFHEQFSAAAHRASSSSSSSTKEQLEPVRDGMVICYLVLLLCSLCKDCLLALHLPTAASSSSYTEEQLEPVWDGMEVQARHRYFPHNCQLVCIVKGYCLSVCVVLFV